MKNYYYLLLTVSFFALQCEAEQGAKGRSPKVNPTDTSPSGDTDTGKSGDTQPDRPDPQDTTVYPVVEICGDGILTEHEACDDKNLVSGDGCAKNCLEVEEGWSCNPPGFPCHPVARCGDGQLSPPELCDDGNHDRGDGCNDLCMIEIGFKCTAKSPSVCTEAECGDGVKEGAEGCDDGNTMPFDGCSANCLLEPSCKDGGNCTSSCGDGMIIDEECDDGNNVDGDGCSAKCETEKGYECTLPDANSDTISVPIVYKDFLASHPDFELGALNCNTVSENMVKDTLGPDGKPVFNQSVGTCGALSALDEWYDNDDPNDLAVVSDTLTLFNNGSGAFVNRADSEGNRWGWYEYEWCDNDSCDGAGCQACPGLCVDDFCWDITQKTACCAEVSYTDGEPHFFPLDGKGITDVADYSLAGTAPPYNENWNDEEEASIRARLTLPDDYSFLHNFSFTSEVRFWFQYSENNIQTFQFLGDDDVWVFINNKLVVDLGGIHSPLEAEVAINDLGLEDGKVYEIAVFQAERQTNGSSYRLTLSGFTMARSECRPECGDGIIGIGEECDDGVNDGGYGQCGKDCKMGAYCGDGIVQSDEGEACDDGNTLNNDACPSSCRNIVVE